MNARERMLLTALVAIVGVGIVGYGAKRWWWDPLKDAHAKQEELQKGVDSANFELTQFMARQAKLNKARLRSLPANPEQASAEYHLQYLKPMLIASGLMVEDLTPGQNAIKMKPVTPIPGVTTVGHQILTFTVRAHGELSNLVTAMDRMQKTPYEHRIKSLIVDRGEPVTGKKAGNKLNIQMNIEVLLVAGTKSKPGATHDPSLVHPVPDDRTYAQISTRNIFVGALPPPPPPPRITKVKPPKDPEPEPEPVVEPTDNTPQYVYLTHTSPDEQIAYLRNRVYKTPEMKLMAKAGSGYDTFKISDEFGAHVFFRAKVLKVELRQVYIQIKDQVFTVGIGQSLADMQQYGFTKSRIELEDEDLFDRAFWEQEKGNQPAKTDNKGKTNKKAR